MRALADCYIYEPEIKRITKANSFMAGGRVIYIVKKDSMGKAMKIYSAYDKESKVLLGANWDKEFLIAFIQAQDLSILPKAERSLF